jgi:hypothetical protein
MTLGMWCIALGEVCSKLTYTLQAFATPKVHLGCIRASGRLPVPLRYNNGLNIVMGCYGHIEKLQLSDT